MMNEELDLELEGMESVELTDEELEEISGGKKTVYVKASEAKIRSGPGKEYSTIWVMNKGDALTYLGEKQKDKHGKTWLKIQVYGVNGWIRSDLVKK